MKHIFKRLVVVPVLAGAAAFTFGLLSGCVERGYYAEEPGPGPVPDEYVWDGYEDVGVVGDQYYYLGPGSVWIICEPYRLERFHGWEGNHHDWRAHAIHNDRFRNANQGHAPTGHPTMTHQENNRPTVNQRHERPANQPTARQNRPPERPQTGANTEHHEPQPAARESHENERPQGREGHEDDGHHDR